jgi:DTW domain-containing protein YfiP
MEKKRVRPGRDESKALTDRLKSEGLSGIALFEALATALVERKEEQGENRCSRCWHDAQQRCICHLVPSLSTTSLPVKVLVLMHYKEYLSAGNDAKLLLAMLPCTELFIFGRKGDWEKFETEV